VIDRPSVSVIIPTHDRGAMLPHAVRSALAAGEAVLEVLVLDDGSTDATPRVIRELLAEDARVRAFAHPNRGQSATVNRGLEEARGEIVVILSDDDLLAPGAADVVSAAFADHPEAVVVYGDFEQLDLHGRPEWRTIVGPTTWVTLLGDHSLEVGVGRAVRSDTARAVGGWDPSLRHAPDLDFFLRLALHGSFVRVPALLGGYRCHDGQISAEARSRAAADEHVAVVERFLARPDLPDEVRALTPRARSAAHAVAAYLHDPDHGAPDRRHLVIDRRSLRESADSKDPVARLAFEAERRLVLLREAEAAAAERGRLVDELHRTAAERLDLIEQLDTELRSLRTGAAERDQLIKELHRTAAERGNLVEELHCAAAERLDVIERLDAELRSLRADPRPADG
jgi:GT2 family glycosyltransferase